MCLEIQCGSPAAFFGTGCPLASIAVMRSVNLQLQIRLANSWSPTILGSRFKLFTLDLGVAFGGLTGLGARAGAGAGTYPLYARTQGERISSKADNESVLGNQVTSRFP